MKTKIILLLATTIILVTACNKNENFSEASKEEKIENINYFFDVTLPDSAEVLQYYYKDEMNQSNIETLEVKVRINKSDYNNFLNSLGEYYSEYEEFNRDFGPSASGQTDLSWWTYDEDEVYDYFEILKTPLHQQNSDEVKMTAYTDFVILDSGDSYDILMSYKG